MNGINGRLTQRLTTSQFGVPPSPEIWREYPLVSEWYLIGHLERLRPTLRFLWQNPVLFGASLETRPLENLVVHGKKRALTLILRTRGRNSGVVTGVNLMLSLMNFGEVSTLPISSDGLTGIRSIWRSRAPLSALRQTNIGLPQTCILRDGTQTLMQRPLQPYSEE